MEYIGYLKTLFCLFTILQIGATVNSNGPCPIDFVCMCQSSKKYAPFGPDEALVDCTGMGLVAVPPLTAFENTRIKEILFNKNNIQSIGPRTFDGLNISMISFSLNPLKEMSFEAFEGIDGLTSLMFSECRLNAIPDVFSFTPDLVDLSLAGNNITLFQPKAFKDLEKLHFLDLSRNPISLNYDTFEGLEQSLRDLRLNGLNVSRIPADALTRLKFLDNLELQDNQITSLDADSFVGLPKNRFTHYIFDQNSITTISKDALKDHPTPIYLDLHGNKIRHVDFIEDPCTMQSSVIHLHGNPIHCDCKLYNLTKYKSLMLHGECATPHQFRRIPIMHDPEEHGTNHGYARSFGVYGAEFCHDRNPGEKIHCPCDEKLEIEVSEHGKHDHHYRPGDNCHTYIQAGAATAILSFHLTFFMVTLIVMLNNVADCR